jgi:hypothetical protein
LTHSYRPRGNRRAATAAGERLGRAADVIAAGDGIETVLALGMAPSAMPMVAALSAEHFAALLLTTTLRRLYVAHALCPEKTTKPSRR